MVVNPTTGELLGSATAAYVWQEEVDQTRFVKLFLDGIRQTVGLTKAGLAVFELVYSQLRESPGVDKVELSTYHAKLAGIEPRTYQRGVRELQTKEFLFASPSEGVFFVNIRFMFNGNRLHFIKSYYLKGQQPMMQQGELGFDESPPGLGFDEPEAP